MQVFKIEENDAHQRLDKFLKKLFPMATRSLIYMLNRKEKVKVKNFLTWEEGKFKRQDNEYKLQVGDEVKIFLNDEDFKTLREDKNKSSWDMPLKDGEKNCLHKEDIVFEDGDLLIVNKNPWINVHPWDFKTKELSLIILVQDYLGEKLSSLTFKPSLVHRIDRDTSGIVMVAKKKPILSQLAEDFKNHTHIKKTYYAIVLGKLSRREGTIKKNLVRIEDAKNENKVQVSEAGQSAVTHYKVLWEHILQTKEGDLVISELEVVIETGRMHQIRVHMASIGNPIVGDDTYGDKKTNAFFEKNFWLMRHALHAWKIEFMHYGRGKKMNLEARIKKDLIDFMEKIKGGNT